MRHLKVVLAYDGSEFHGWQVQPGLRTVQGTLAESIQHVTSEAVLPQGSGRTDAGVHALAQVASFALASPIPAANLKTALNHDLPPAIRVLEVSEVPPGFHARRSARAKTYRYRIYRGEICPPFLARYVYHHPYPLDEPAMMRAAGLVVGEHDFTSFAAVDPERKAREGEGEPVSNVRTVFLSQWERVVPPTDVGPAALGRAAQDHELVYIVRGSGFLHHMVRNLVGTFLLLGKGSLDEAGLRRILEARDRSAAGATAPPGGLYLVSVEY
jgi:tRNA pseudouridine38-40 synthase